MYLPNFITIGAMKSGTTSIHEYLNQHPDIFMSEKKEIDFFCHEDKYQKGIDWYKSFFPENAKVRGESSQNYSKYHWWSDVPKKIYHDLGVDVKFLYILRDPLDRVYSHYNEMQEQNCAPKSLEEYILKDLETNEIVLTSCYKKQLDKFLEYYPINNFKIVTLERLKKERLNVMNEIFEFLGLTKIDDEELFNFSKNTSQEKKARTALSLFVSQSKMVKAIKNIFPRGFIDGLKQKSVTEKLFFKKIDLGVKMSKETEVKLKKIFKKDTDELRQLANLKIEEWCV